MKIAVIGTGCIGGTLGRRWAQKGHEVTFCSRTPGSDKVRALLDAFGAAGSELERPRRCRGLRRRCGRHTVACYAQGNRRWPFRTPGRRVSTNSPRTGPLPRPPSPPVLKWRRDCNQAGAPGHRRASKHWRRRVCCRLSAADRSFDHGSQAAVQPPSIINAEPVTSADASDAR